MTRLSAILYQVMSFICLVGIVIVMVLAMNSAMGILAGAFLFAVSWLTGFVAGRMIEQKLRRR